MKRCYKCNTSKHLFLFKKDSSVYQVQFSQGRCISCRKCSIKLAFKVGGVMQRVEGKFAFVEMSKFQIIKHFLK